MDNKYNEKNWFELVTEECRDYPMQSCRNCIDIGANVGGFIEAHKDKVRNFFCVEAGSSNIEELKNNHKDLIESGRVSIIHNAVHDKSGETLSLKRLTTVGEKEFANSGSNSVCNFDIEDGCGWFESEDFEKVSTISFDDLMKKASSFFGGEAIDCMKIDCEGSEYDFLINQDLSKIESIVMEIHNFLDCLPSKNNPEINQRYDLISHILKTHDQSFHSGMPEYLSPNIIAKVDRHPWHGVIQFTRRKT